MSGHNETLADIVAEMRHGFDQSWHDIDREWAHELADRIEAAAKREREMSKNVSKNGADFGQFGNAAAMRDALILARERIVETKEFYDGACDHGDLSPLLAKIDSALAAPPRNCDVGTVEEQEARYRATGRLYHILTLANALKWAQMPCDEKGGAICG